MKEQQQTVSHVSVCVLADRRTLEGHIAADKN